jgi:predicted NACHT family NTPase
VSAHRLATATITTFEETILESTLSRIGDGKSSEESLSIRLFVDGLDEVPDRSQQQRIINMLRDGLNRHPKVSVIVTARPYVWGAWMNWMPRVHMAEFTADQQRLLASKWIADETQVNQLFSELDSSPALLKLMGTPLLATLILNLFSRTPVLPENKVSLYRTFVDLYCGGWDAAKGIAKIGRFKSEQKLRLLTALAYRMHVAHKAECTEDRCISVLKEIMPALQSQGMDILTEIVQDGILVRAGRDLVFAHLSFQEYLAAQFLASDPLGARPKQALLSYLRGEDWWKEVVEFYLISRDDPTALDGWIDRIAAGATRSNDIAHRLDRLAIVIHEAFAGFKTTFTNSRQ